MHTKNLIITTIIVIIALLALIPFLGRQTGDGEEHDDGTVAEYEIYPGDVVEKLQNSENVILLDVRTPEEYEQMHLQNALLLPVQELSQQSLNAIGLGENMKDAEIYLYCRSGARSKTAYDIMSSLGYTNIKSVAGGMIHWEEDEYPFVETGAYVPPENAPSATANTSAPKIAFDRMLHDFDMIPQYGGVVETTFTVRNNGQKTLSIGALSTSCACTSAKLSVTEILAGGEATLTVAFDPNLHAEPPEVFKRTIFIPSNDPDTPEAEVTIQVDIDEGK